MYGSGSVDMKKPDWNLAKKDFLKTDIKITFNVFRIGVPCSARGSSLLRDLDDILWKDFCKAMQGTYRTATIRNVGTMLDPHFGKDLIKARQCLEAAKAKRANFVMLLLEKKSIPVYSIFKELADCQYGMHSLCVIYTKKLDVRYWGNVAMKLNLKAGGINHTVAGVESIMKDALVLGACVVAYGSLDFY
jgi:eukaryotic translation initiation factor 2C